MTITTRLSDWFINLSRGQKILVRLLLLLLLALILLFVFVLPLPLVPLETPIARGSDAATATTTRFWQIFHANDVEQLPTALVEMSAAYAAGPADPTFATVLAGAYLWRFQGRGAFGQSAAEAKGELEQALHYAKEAERLLQNRAPNTSTVPSVIATVEWLLAVIEQDERQRAQIHRDLLVNTQVYPQFAGFVQGWILATMLEPADPAYRESPLGYEVMLDACAGFVVPEDEQFNRLIHSFYSLKTLVGDRTCYNNPVAPHNIEGTFLGLGDIWLKQGNLERARIWYENVKTAPTYGSWQFKPALEARLADLEGFSRRFAADTGQLDVMEPAMSFQSEISCAVCHAQ